ncbi:MAG: DinB family protein [Chloroflexota bacterium]|nr:DinB family protein [Chloroflexota bacterium]
MPPERVADLLESSSALIEAEVKALGPDAAWHPAPGEWCAHEVVGHIVEAEKRGFAGRIRLFLEHDHPSTEAWDQVEIARERADCGRDSGSLWSEFAALRRESVALVRSLRPEDLGRSGAHSKVGELFVRDLLQEWVHHDRNHTKQLLAIAQERAWPHMGNAQKFLGD